MVMPMREATARRLQRLRWLLVGLALLAAAIGALSAPPARQVAVVMIVTIADGDATLIRGATRFGLSEGTRLRNDDIVETGAGTRLLRLESVEGDALDLGPATRLMLAPAVPTSRSHAPARIYLQQGWVKWTAVKAPPPGALLTAGIDIDGLARSVVIARVDDSTFVFAESGDLNLTEHAGGHDTPRPLRSDRFLVRAPDGASSIANRPTADFIARMPRPFVDTLPSRVALFAARDTPPRPLGDIDYADVQPWIDSEPALRRTFVVRWRARAATPAFRKGLVAGLASHPEWDRTLYPEKYLPKRPPASISTSPQTSPQTSPPTASRTP